MGQAKCVHRNLLNIDLIKNVSLAQTKLVMHQNQNGILIVKYKDWLGQKYVLRIHINTRNY